MMERATATNKQKEDAHHGTYLVFASFRFVASIGASRIYSAKSKRLLSAVHVSCHSPMTESENK